MKCYIWCLIGIILATVKVLAAAECDGHSNQTGQCIRTLQCLREKGQHIGVCQMPTGRTGSCCIVEERSTTEKPQDEAKSSRAFNNVISSSVNSKCQVTRTTQRSRRGRIIGGDQVSDTKFPSAVKITNDFGAPFFYKLVCGGTLLQNGWVITAAHCLEKSDELNPEKYRYSVYNPATMEREEFSPLLTLIHPSWNSEDNFKYDAGLVKLNIPEEILEQLSPACLSPTEDLSNLTASITGWGLEDAQDRYSQSDQLKELEVKVYPPNTCFFEKVQDDRFDLDLMICAGQDREIQGQDPCKGDSGGGLLVAERALIGIVSWGLHCGRRNRPTVYQRIAPIKSWIDNTIA